MVEVQENINSVNRMVSEDAEAKAFQEATAQKRQKFLEQQKSDPVFVSSDEEGGEDAKKDDESEGSGSEESSEEELDFPREDAQELLQYLHREITNLSNLEDNTKRKFALVKLYQIFVLAKNKPTNRVY